MNPIIIEEKALVDIEEGRIRSWLNMPECLKFQAYLESRAAICAAEAGNSLVEGGESSQSDATNHAEQARLHEKLSQLMSEMRNPEKHFSTVTLTPKPITTTSP